MLWMLLLQSLPAFPCAAMISREGEFVSSDAQEVIFRHTDAGSKVSYRVNYDGDASEFGWVIVVPGEVSDVAEGDEEEFSALRDATDPGIRLPAVDSGGGGCDCDASLNPKSAGGGDGLNFADTGGGVDILIEGFSGPYEYTVLSADDDADLIAWLDAHDFELGGSETTLAEYVEEGGFSFVAVTLTPDEADTPPEGRTLPPLDIWTDSTELRFAARIAQTGTPEWVRTTVWVIGANAATIESGWYPKDVTWLNAGDQDASEFYAEHLQKLAISDPVYARIFTGQIDESWVTRLDTYAARRVHTVDPVFAFVLYGTDNKYRHLEIISDDTSSAWLFLPLLGLGWGLRRRRQSPST